MKLLLENLVRIGIVTGKVTTSEFSFKIDDIEKTIKGQYVIAIDKRDKRVILAQIVDIIRTGQISTAFCDVLGEIKDSKLFSCKRPIASGSIVYLPPSKLLSSVITRTRPEKGLLVGKILTHPELVPIYYNFKDLARHFLITATTGGGKSYTIAVIIEELVKLIESGLEKLAVVVFDLHNEYGGLAFQNIDEAQVKILSEYGLSPRTLEERLLIFDWDYNPPHLSPLFTPDRLLFIYGVKEQRFALILKELMGEREKIKLEELLNEVEASDLHPSTKQALITRIRALMESGLFSQRYITPRKFLIPGYVTIFRLANTPLGDYGIRFFVADVLKNIFEEAKGKGLNFKVVIILDEAHFFAPRKGRQDPVREIIARIAREGRKYGVWLILATQSPRDLSKEVIMNCNSLLALKLQREDAVELSRIFGIHSNLIDVFTTLAPGNGYLKAPSFSFPVFIHVRPKMTMDPKGSPELLQRIEKKMIELAEKTKHIVEEKIAKKRRKVTLPKQPPVEQKAVIAEKKLEKKIAPPPPPEKTLPAPPPPPAVPKKKEAPKLEKKIEIRKAPRIAYEKEVLQSIIEEIYELGPASMQLLREILELKAMPLSLALAKYDASVIDSLRFIGIIRERGNTIVLSLKQFLEIRLGRKLSEHEVREYEKYLMEYIS